MTARKPIRKTSAGVLERTPFAEMLAAGVGFVLTLTVLGYSVWQAVHGNGEAPALSVAAHKVTSTAGGHLVEIRVRNGAGATAAAVEVEGVLDHGGGEPERATATFDYVPGKGSSDGGLLFAHDPASGRLSLSVKGYAKP